MALGFNDQTSCVLRNSLKSSLGVQRAVMGQKIYGSIYVSEKLPTYPTLSHHFALSEQ